MKKVHVTVTCTFFLSYFSRMRFSLKNISVIPPSKQNSAAVMATSRYPKPESVPMVAIEVNINMAMLCPSLKQNVLAAKNIPCRFSPVFFASYSATSATIACGKIPKIAIGSEPKITIKIPCAKLEIPRNFPETAVMA